MERVASHVAFMADGRLLLTGTLDDVKERLVRLRVLCEGVPPDPSAAGWHRAAARPATATMATDPSRSPTPTLAALRVAPGVREMQETPLTLEEAYCALLEQKEELP